MREIKFRAKHKATGEWWYGSSSMYKQILNICPMSIFWMYYDTNVFDKETLGEWTGLRNIEYGREIYEGDILSPRWVVKFGDFEFLSGEDHYSKDIYSSGYGWHVEDSKDGTCQQLLLEACPADEVVGNIWESPEGGGREHEEETLP